MLFADLSPLEQWIAHEEGYRSKPHLCPANYLSIGLGYNIEAHAKYVSTGTLIRWCKDGCDHAEAIRLLQSELRGNRRELERHTWFIRLSAIRQAAIENMAYQLGVTGVMRFRMMIRALRDGDHGNASLEMLDSKWATVDTPERAERVSQVMHTAKPIEWAGVPAGW